MKTERCLLSYVVKYAGGFAPNPYGGFLTLATCKPKIRQTAKAGDCLVGTGSAANVGNDKLIYAAEISAVVPIADYGRMAKYRVKRPSDRGWQRLGDNIYYFKNGEWHQRENQSHGPDSMEKDVSGENVLICNRFWYFGKDAVEIPWELRGLIKKGPGHKKIIVLSTVETFMKWIETFRTGIIKDLPKTPLSDDSTCDSRSCHLAKKRNHVARKSQK